MTKLSDFTLKTFHIQVDQDWGVDPGTIKSSHKVQRDRKGPAVLMEGARAVLLGVVAVCLVAACDARVVVGTQRIQQLAEQDMESEEVEVLAL